MLAANPMATPDLALTEEARAIEETLRLAEDRDAFELVTRWAVRPDDLMRHLNEQRPHIVHFSGHGSDTGEITLSSGTGREHRVTTEALAELFRNMKDNIRIVFLNACYTAAQAQAISAHIDYVIGMRAPIDDRAATVFAGAFYSALGFRRTVHAAFGQAITAVMLHGLPGHAIPELITRAGAKGTPGQNVRHTDAPVTASAGTAAASLGALGRAHLAKALATLAVHPPADPDLEYLIRITRELPTGGGPAQARARDMVTRIQLTAITARFVRSAMGRSLSSAALHRAFARLDSFGVPRSVTRTEKPSTELDFIEQVALCRTGNDWSARRSLAYFVALLAGSIGLELQDPGLRAWADQIGASLDLNDAAGDIHTAGAAVRLRLIVSLHASVTGDRWPEALDVWLLDRDGTTPETKQIPCTPPDQVGVEAALREAVEWAEDKAHERSTGLTHVDVAVPAGLLLRWRPENADYGLRLGLNYDVLTRWAGRIAPSRGERWIITGLVHLLADAGGDVPDLRWLPEPLAHDHVELDRQLRDGRYPYALGFARCPQSADVLSLLLKYVPAVVWPDGDELSGPHQDIVCASWSRMPGAIIEAFRQSYTRGVDNPLADLRLVWDDEDWLTFCRRVSDPVRERGRS